jgi:hypothetical protein
MEIIDRFEILRATNTKVAFCWSVGPRLNITDHLPDYTKLRPKRQPFSKLHVIKKLY